MRLLQLSVDRLPQSCNDKLQLFNDFRFLLDIIHFVYNNNGYDFNLRTTTPWENYSGDAAFIANFSAGSAQAVPEPFTIIGTLVGGTAAFRMKRKLKLAAK